MIRVDNLQNLFWDNGSWKYPNTYPHLINGKWLENITPVMTSPVTGWVVLEGEYNYCQYNDELFFLKKDKRISVAKNKWRYILIKDHLCTIFKNKANIVASGTLINTDLEHLKKDEFQFTFPVFTSFNKRILLPLTSGKYNWKEHLIPLLPNKVFDNWETVGNREFTELITTLIQNREILGKKKSLEELLKGNKYCTLLGIAPKSKKTNNWKNELVQKIKDFVSEIKTNPEIVFGKISGTAHTFPKEKGRYAITYDSYSLIGPKETSKQITNIDLSGLTDIKLLDLTTSRADSNRSYFPITLSYQDSLLDDDPNFSVESARFIKKLSRRVRLPFCNPYTSRAVIYSKNKFSTWYWSKPDMELFYPQKIYFKISPTLTPLDKYSRDFPEIRKKESFRTVYLYYCYNLDFVFLFNTNMNNKNTPLPYWWEKDFISPVTYFGNPSDIRTQLSLNLTSASDSDAIKIIEKDGYEEYYPWGAGGTLHTKEHLNIGWLVGQFSQHIKGNSAYFEDDYPFIIKDKVSRLKRIEGLNPVVATLTQNQDAYKKPTVDTHHTYDESHIWTLDIFNPLPARARGNTIEEDFLIGEKLLFTTWGLAPYILFQPANLNNEYSYYWFNNLETTDSRLIGKWLYWGVTTQGWYPYQLFDNGDGYILEHAKNWFKKAYESFAPLDYQKFYENLDSFRVLKTHIQKNTEIYFKTKEVALSETPIKELKAGDIFFSNQEWFWFDQSGGEGVTVLAHNKNDFLIHSEDKKVRLEDGDVVVYCTPKDNQLHVGKVSVWDSEFNLPDNQFIEEGSRINSPSSDTNTVKVQYTKITNIEGFDSFDSLIEGLKQKSEIFFSELADFSLEDLNDKYEGTYLFDLVGTGFKCVYHGGTKRVHLIFKEEEEAKSVGEITEKFYTVGADSDIRRLTKTQWINQQIKISLYGQKIDLPVKAIEDGILASIKINTAQVKGAIQEHIESHKVEVKHKLGTMYCRFDVPKTITTSKITDVDAFSFAELNMRHKRHIEDYLISRRQFDINTERMTISHNSQRMEHKWAQAQAWTNSITGGFGLGAGTLGAIGGLATKIGTAFAKGPIGLGALVLGGVSYGISKAVGFGRNVANASWHLQEQGRFMEEQIDVAIREKALQSYSLDLNFERQKEDHLFNMRRLFANASFNSSSSRDRNKLLDAMEDKPLGEEEIYLELWTTSEEQDKYVQDYHKKHGVDCRVPDVLLSVKNGMEAGIYTMEDVELTNLYDRIDLMFLKGRLENGIKLVEWKEHEKVQELIPVDPRITKLQKALELAEKNQIQLEQDKRIQDLKINELQELVNSEKDKLDQLTFNYNKTTQDLEKAKKDIESRDRTIENEGKKYHELATTFTEQQKELRESHQTTNLYREQTITLRKTVEDTKTQLSQKTEEMEQTIKRLEQSELDKSGLQQQLESEKEDKARKEQQIQQDQAQLAQLQQRIGSYEREQVTKELRIQELSVENDRLKGELQVPREVKTLQARIKETEKQISALREIDKGKDLKIAQLETERGQPYLEWLGEITDTQYLRLTEYDEMSIEYFVQKERNKIIQPHAIFIIKEGFYDYEVIRLSSLLKAFVPAIFSKGERTRIWRYGAYELFTLGGESGKNKVRVKQSVWNGWISYFDEIQTTWEQLITRKVIGSGNITGWPIFFLSSIAEYHTIPFFKVKKYTMRSGDSSGSVKKYVSLENGPIFWDSDTKTFRENAYIKQKTLKQIYDYKTYRELFRLEQVKGIDFETRQEFQHWWNTEGDGAKEEDITFEYDI